MALEHPDLWDSSKYPHAPGDDEEPDLWEKEAGVDSKSKKKPPKSTKLEPDNRTDFHGDDDLDIWEREGSKPPKFGD